MTAPADAGWRRQVHTAPVMGTVASIHLITVDGVECAAFGDACRAAVAELARLEAIFSPFRTGSQINRIRRGELAPAQAGVEVATVADACVRLRDDTGGLFDAWWRGWFDPTGYVKGWAVERVARRHLRPLLEIPGVSACGMAAGGDMQLFTAPGSGWEWAVGIADPRTPGRVLATVRVADGAVATSGVAERGAHIIDPRTGGAVTELASATVTADTLTDADVWATTAMVAGWDGIASLRDAPVRAGLLVHGDGRVRRWAGGVEISGADALVVTAA